MLKLLFSLFLTVAAACAASLTVNLDFPTLSASAGQTVTFTGTISNGFTDTVDLNSLSVNVTGSGFTADTTPFFLGPLDVTGLSTTVSFALFSITLDDPFPSPSGLYNGTVDLLGGVQVGGVPDPGVFNLLGQGTFEVNVVQATDVPEPAFGPMLLAAGGVAVFYRRRCLR